MYDNKHIAEGRMGKQAEPLIIEAKHIVEASKE